MISIGKIMRPYGPYLQKVVCPKCDKTRKIILRSKTMKRKAFYCGSCASKRRIPTWLYKKITLAYYNNGTISSSPSVSEFCRQRPNLGKYAKHHFSGVLNKQRIHYKGWILPETKGKINFKKAGKIKQILIKQAIFDNR